jgi:hypothetical protein
VRRKVMSTNWVHLGGGPFKPFGSAAAAAGVEDAIYQAVLGAFAPLASLLGSKPPARVLGEFQGMRAQLLTYEEAGLALLLQLAQVDTCRGWVFVYDREESSGGQWRERHQTTFQDEASLSTRLGEVVEIVQRPPGVADAAVA